MIIKKIILALFLVYFFSFKAVFSLENKILFKLNNEIITSVDILNEYEYLKLLNKNLSNLDNDKIFEISKNSIIREKIKILELSKYTDDFKIDQKYYNLLMKDFLKKLNLENMDQFKKYISERNIDILIIEKKIQIELLWNKLILEKFSKDVKIDKTKIDEEIYKSSFQKEYLLSEILFNLDLNEKLEDKFKQIKIEIETNGFENAALLHSVSATASSGGKLSWIKLNSLNDKIKKNILKTNMGNFTNPIVIPGGFLILKVENIKETKIDRDVEKQREIITNQIANKQLNQFSNIYFNKIKKEVQINEY